MLIIVEGMDNTGKTTLVDWIVSEMIMRKRSCRTFKSDNGVNPHERMLKLIEVCNDDEGPPIDVINDRIPAVGEYVYGDILRGENRFDQSFEDLWSTFLRVSYTNTLFIYCRPENYEPSIKSEMEGVIDNQWKLLQRYDYLMLRLQKVFKDSSRSNLRGSNIQFIHFDWTKHQYEYLEGEIFS